jgi:hypothetical protein
MSWRTLISSGFSTEFRLFPLDKTRGRNSPLDSENNDYRSTIELDLSTIADSYIRMAESAIYSGDSLPKVKILVGTISTKTNKSVTLEGFRSMFTYDVNS